MQSKEGKINPIDDEIWDFVTGPILAAQKGDVKAHDRTHKRWLTDLPIDRQRRVEVCIRYLLGYKLFTSFSHSDDGQLHDLAVALAPKANRLIKGTVSMYESAFRTVLGRPLPKDALPSITVDMASTATLGALLGDDPLAELTAMRPHLDTYYRDNWGALREVELE